MKGKSKVINTALIVDFVLMENKYNTMKYKLIFLFFFNTCLYSQILHHQMLSAQGKSVVIANGMLVNQSIGQQSATGNYKKGYVVRQGFQQSNWEKLMHKNKTSIISTVTYPNPFLSTINFQFSQVITDEITVTLYDAIGRLVFQQEAKATGNILTIELSQLPASSYLVLLKAPNYIYYSKLLKQQ